jgi:hypothetical protein
MIRRVGAAVGLVLVLAVASHAQDMEPKAYAASPVGANFFVVSATRSTGDVLFDPTLPLTDVDATVYGYVVAVGHTFGLFGDLALVTAALPYATADFSGKINEQAAGTARSGLADAQFKLSVNLVGNAAMPPREFARARRRTIVGTSLTVRAPTGQYYDSKLINIGNNRWGFKPEVGVSVPIRRVDVDAYIGGWFFTANDDFYTGGVRRTQDPVLAAQAHVSYTLRPRLWVAFDSTWYSGGASRVGDGNPTAGMNNSRAGVTVSMPLGARYSVKAAYASGVSVRTGEDFTTVAVAFQALWLSHR